MQDVPVGPQSRMICLQWAVCLQQHRRRRLFSLKANVAVKAETYG